MASPRTPTARKAPSSTTPSKSKPRSSQASRAAGKKCKAQSGNSGGSSSNGPKRRAKTEVSLGARRGNCSTSLTIQLTVSAKNATRKEKSKSARTRTSVAYVMPEKKENVDHVMENGMANETNKPFPPFENRSQFQLHTPFETPSPTSLQSPQSPSSISEQKSSCITSEQQPSFDIFSQQQQQNISAQLISPSKSLINNAANINIDLDTFDSVIVQAYQSNPSMFPQSRSTAITSAQIDEFTNNIWQTCLLWKDGQLMNSATLYGAVLSGLKLRTLAKLNLLPSWWFLRERVMQWLQDNRRLVDESFMDGRFREANKQLSKTLGKRDRMVTQANAVPTTGHAGVE